MDSVGIVIIAKKTNKFLLLHRVQKPIVWSILTGTMDVKGEKPIQTVKREIEEEIKLKSSLIKNIQKVGSLTNKNGSIFHVFVGFVNDEFTPNLELKENDNFKWSDEDTLPKNIHNKWDETYNLVKDYLNLKEMVSNKIKKLLIN
jgi:8-oxo-dGTP pyrophosphatase MutT (NUDIX family)